LGIDSLDKSGLILAGMSAGIPENLLRDFRAGSPPVDFQSVDFVLKGDFPGNPCQHATLWPAMSIDNDNILEAVADQTFQHGFDIGSVDFGRYIRGAGIRRHAARDPISHVWS